MSDLQQSAAPSGDHVRLSLPVPLRILAIVVGTILVIAALKLAKTVLVPLVAGIFFAVLVRPLHSALRTRLPRWLQWLAMLASVLTLVAGIVLFSGVLAVSGRAIAEELSNRRPAIEAQIEKARARAERAGLPVPSSIGSGDAPASASGGSSTGDSAGSGAASKTLVAAGATIGGILLSLAFAALALAEADVVRKRIAGLGKGSGARRALDAIDEITPAFRRYAWVKSITSLITGTATGLAAWAFGLPIPWVWGLIAFLLEYIPSVGSVIAVVPPALMGLAQGGATRGLTVLLTIGLMQVILGNVVDPRLEGKLMSVSPFGVLLSIVFWGWLWGAPGALLAVPMTVAVVIAASHIPGAHGVAKLVAGDGE